MQLCCYGIVIADGQHDDKRLARLESQVAASVRAYISGVACGNAPEEQLQRVLMDLEYLLGQRLSGCDGWKSSYWLDGLVDASGMIPDSISVVSDGTLTVRGYADWSKGGASEPFWIEPFFGSVSPNEIGDELVSYTLCFGDAIRGLAHVPYGTHLRRPDWFYPEKWWFVFSNENKETI
jgi:hypothetical protein